MPQDQDRPITLEEFEEQRRKYYGIPAGLAASLRQQESGGRQYDRSGGVLTSPKQARGRYQVLKSTAAKYGLNPDDPFENVEASFRYLSDLNKQVDAKVTDPGERWAQTLAGYHAGEGRLREVNKTGSLPSTSDGLIRTDEYVANIMKRWQQHDQGQAAPQQPAQAKRPQSTARRLGLKPEEGMYFDLRDPSSAGKPAKPKRPKGEAEAEAALIGPYDPAGYDKQGRPLTPQREAFERKPFLQRKFERAMDEFRAGGLDVSKAARQALGFVAGGPYAGPMDFPAWREREEERRRNLAERERARPPMSLAEEIGGGIVRGVPTAGGAIALGTLTGGGALGTAAIGGGMSAAGADWSDPKRAALETGVGAIAPVVGGRIGREVGGRVASRLARPAAQSAARAGGEVIGGATGNVGGALAMGETSPRELTRQAFVGGALSAPGAMAAARRPVARPITEPLQTPQPAVQPGPVTTTGAETAPPRVQPEATRRTTEIPRVQPEAARQTAEMPRPVYPDAPETQEMPAIQRRITAENAPTAELPAIAARQPLQPPRPRTERLLVPKATEETIDAIRKRQEELGRLAYDRRGDFTGDLRDEYNQLTARIRDYDNEQAKTALGGRLEDVPPPGTRQQRMTPPPEERSARRAALQPRQPITAEFPEASFGRKVTQETQLPPGLKVSESHATREDARQGHFERFDDAELVDEIRRMEDVRNQAIRGKSRLTPAQREANEFDLRIAVEMQKERGRIQRGRGREPEERIEPRTPGRSFKHAAEATEGRKIQHSQFGAVTEAADQAGVGKGRLRVVDEAGKPHIIRNPRIAGNREAAFIKSTGAIPAEAMPELRSPNAPPSPLAGKAAKAGRGISYAIPDEAMPELRDRPRSRGTVMGSGLGALQPLFERGQKPSPQPSLFGGEKPPSLSRKEISETAGGVQTVSQLGNPRFVIRNVLQHVAFGKQERAATRIAAALDWAYSKASGKPRQVMAPRGSDLAAYVRNWGKAVQAYKKGQPLPGRPNVDYVTADANKLDKAVGKVMTWINEIPDAANWQTRFEQSLQSIIGNSKRLRAPLDMDGAIDQAMMEANRASLRDPNFASAALLKIKEGLNKASSPIFGTDKFGLGDLVLKYAQTPGALLKRGLERSPLGLFQVAKEAATPGPFRRRNTLLALSRVAEGAVTGIGMGAALAAAGVLVGPEEEGRAGKAMEREEGVRGYSLNASALLRFLTGESAEMQQGDTLYSIDWLQPWAMNVSVGAALWSLHKSGKMGAGAAGKATGEAIYNSLAKTLDVMGDQSVLKNLSRYMDKAQGDTFSDKFLNFAKAVGLDVPSSFVPSTLRQARQVIDPFERDTRPEQRSGVSGFVEEAKNRALAQLPGMSERFPKRPSLLTGEDRKTALGEMSVPARIAAQFSPANISTYMPRPVAQEISRLNRAGEKVSVSFPQAATDKRTGKREPTSELRGRERRFAEEFSRLSREMIDDPLYQDSDDQTKAAAFAGLKQYLAALEKGEVEEKLVTEIIEAAMEAVEKRREAAQ